MAGFAVLVALSIVLSYLAYQEWRTWMLLEKFGADVEGRVQQLGSTKTGRARGGTRPVYFLMYEFDGVSEDGKDFYFTKHTNIDLTLYQHLKDGNPPIVRYARPHPDIFCLKGHLSAPVYFPALSFGAWILTIFIAIRVLW